jgi:hypothetical protein
MGAKDLGAGAAQGLIGKVAEFFFIRRRVGLRNGQKNSAIPGFPINLTPKRAKPPLVTVGGSD